MKRIWNFITSVKNVTGNLLFLALIGLLIFALVSQETPGVPDSAVLIVDPEGIIVEQERAVDPVEKFLAGQNSDDAETLVRHVTDAIELATTDERIKAIALDLSKLNGSSIAQYEATVRQLGDFKAAGKSVYAFGSSYSQSQYYLAAHADRIYIDKDAHTFLGGVFMQGIGAYPLYMKSALDKLYVNMHVFKAGLYKDAAETFLRDDMSEFSRESTQTLINELWQHYIETVAAQRNLEPAAITNYVNEYDKLLEAADDPAELAVQQGLVDALVSRVEWREEMQAISGRQGDTYQHINFRNYLAATQPPIPVVNPTTDKVAVIVAKGTILDGDQPAGEIGGDSVARLIRDARNDDTVKAIVLRIDSPGGSASASELIRSELEVTQESGKPVVASMGGYAASGGYWIASTANRIFASATTITGSIGVFALFPTFENSIEKLGVNSDGVGTTALSGAFNQFAAVNPVFENMLQQSVDRSYRKFLSLVSEGRGMPVEEVDSVAQGRVWSGDDALDHGLVDAIGGLEDAIDSAAILADLDDYDVLFMEKQLSPREQFIRQILESAASLLPIHGGLVSLVPHEIRTLAEIARQPGLYLQCVQCNVSF